MTVYNKLYVLYIENYVYNRVNLVTTRDIRFHPHTLPDTETNIVALLWNTRSTVHRRSTYAVWKMYTSREYYVHKDNEVGESKPQSKLQH